MTSISGMSTETRLFNLIPEPSEFRKQPFYKSQRPSTASSRVSKNTQSTLKNSQKNLTKQEKINQKIQPKNAIKLVDQHQSEPLVKNPHYKAYDDTFSQVPDDFSEYNRLNPYKRPPMPKKPERPQQKINNFVQKNQENLNNQFTRTQNLQVLKKKEQEEQKKHEEKVLKEKFGKVPDYLKNKQEQEIRDYYKMHREALRGKSQQKQQSFNNIQEVRTKKAKLKKEYDDLMKRYQAKYGHKTKIDLREDREQKKNWEQKFYEIEQQMKQFQKYEEQNRQFLEDTRSVFSSSTIQSTFTTFQRKQSEINEHDKENNKKLQQKKLHYNVSQNHRFAPVKK